MRRVPLRILLSALFFALSLSAFALPTGAEEPTLRIGLRYGASDTATATFVAGAGASLQADASGVALSTSSVGFTVRPFLYGVLVESEPTFAGAQSAAAALPTKMGLALGGPGGSSLVLDLPYATSAEAQSAAATDGVSGAEGIGPWGVLIRGASSLADAEAEAQSLVAGGAVKAALPFFMTNGSWGVLAGLEDTEAEAQADLPAVQSAFPTATVRAPTGKEGIVSDGAGGGGFLVAQLNSLSFAGTGDPALAGFGGTLYRGSLGVVETSSNLLTVVNSVAMEDYVMGVVPREMPASWPKAALEAQAVASRTFALTHIGQFASQGFDLLPSTVDQVYGGYSAEQPATDEAVQATAGQIVTYDGQPIQAYFFADSGGATEDSQNVWVADLPYLQGVDELPGYQPTTWVKVLSAQTLASLVTQAGASIGSVVGMVEGGTSQTFSGRPLTLTVRGTTGSYTVKKDNIRAFLAIRSTLFTISTDAEATLLGEGGAVQDSSLQGVTILGADGASVTPASGSVSVEGAAQTKTISLIPTTYTLNGRGDGHGVGMPQDGVHYMAMKGYTYQQILEYYYKGVQIGQM